MKLLWLVAMLAAGCLGAPADDGVAPHDAGLQVDAREERRSTNPSADPAEPTGGAPPVSAETRSNATQDHAGSWFVGWGAPGGCYGGVIKVPLMEEGEGVWYHRMDIDAATWGAPFSVRVDPSEPVQTGYLDHRLVLGFADAGGNWIRADATANPWQGTPILANGTVPAGAATAVFAMCEAIGPFSLTYHAGPAPSATQHHKGSWLTPDGCHGDVLHAPPLDEGHGIWYDRMDIDVGTWGLPFTVQFRADHTVPVGYLAQSATMVFYNAGGTLLGEAHSGGYANPLGMVSGTVPSGATTAVSTSCETVGPVHVEYHAGRDP